VDATWKSWAFSPWRLNAPILVSWKLDVKKIITTLPKTLDRQQVDEAHKNLVAAYPFGHLIPGPDGFDFVVEVPDEPEEDKQS
jgi:hypothetical protein